MTRKSNLSASLANSKLSRADLNYSQEDIHALASKAEFLVLTGSNTDLRKSSRSVYSCSIICVLNISKIINRIYLVAAVLVMEVNTETVAETMLSCPALVDPTVWILTTWIMDNCQELGNMISR